MPINDEEIQRVIKPLEPEEPPELTVPEFLRKFAGKDGVGCGWFTLWQVLDFEALKLYLDNTRRDGDLSQMNFHHRIWDHINSAKPWIDETLSRLYRLPGGHGHLRTQVDLVNDRMTSVTNRLIPEAELPPIDLQLTYRRASSKSKNEGRTRPAPRAPLHIAVPLLELMNGEFTQKFSEYELSSVIADITGYTNISRYRRSKLNDTQRGELIEVLSEMIGRIKSDSVESRQKATATEIKSKT